MARRYKWIAAEIERLDPEVDYERIWALSSTYWVDEFMMSFLYSVSFPKFMMPANGGRTAGRARHRPGDHRPGPPGNLETVHHFWTWFGLDGPSSEHTRASVEQVVTRCTAASAVVTPGDFGDPEDFVYTLCYLGAGYHRIRQLAGLPGYTNRQQIAAHRHWWAMAELFGTETGPVADFPSDFAAMVTFLDQWESRHQDWIAGRRGVHPELHHRPVRRPVVPTPAALRRPGDALFLLRRTGSAGPSPACTGPAGGRVDANRHARLRAGQGETPAGSADLDAGSPSPQEAGQRGAGGGPGPRGSPSDAASGVVDGRTAG